MEGLLMCVGGKRAKFTGAIALGAEVTPYLHLLGYQNTSQNLHDGPNCMLLHVPAAELRPGNFLGTTSSRHFMEDIGANVPELFEYKGVSFGADSRPGRQGIPPAFVLAYGAYELVVASAAQTIPAALAQVSEAKRPAVDDSFLDLINWFGKNKPFHSFVLACFNNTAERANHPILVSYQPLDPTKIFVPGLEAHDGKPPVLGSLDGPRDIKVAFGTQLPVRIGSAYGVNYRDNLGTLDGLLPRQVVGFHDPGVGANDDYVVPVEAVRNGFSGLELFGMAPAHAAAAARLRPSW